MLNVYMAITLGMSQAPSPSSDLATLFWVGVSCVGFILWLYTYVLAIRYGHRHQSYAIPSLAVCFNFSWEVLASLVWNMEYAVWQFGCVLWMLFDLPVVYQLYRHGPRVQTIPEVRDNFRWLLTVTLLLCALGQRAFTQWSQDSMGIVDSYLINLVMSVSFIFMYLHRRQADDLTYAISWYKMLGTGIVSVTMIPLFPKLYPGVDTSFMVFLCPLVAVVDCFYIGLLAKARRQRARLQDKAEAPPLLAAA